MVVPHEEVYNRWENNHEIMETFEQEQALLRPAEYVKVEDLQPCAGGVNIVVQVTASEIIRSKPLIAGGESRLAEVTVADETGCILLQARNGMVVVSVIVTVLQRLRKNSCSWGLQAVVDIIQFL